MNYTIELNSHQVGTLKSALEVYSRMLSGQFDIALEECFLDRAVSDDFPLRVSTFRDLDDIIKIMIFPELSPNGSYGVGSQVYPEKTVAWDMMQVLRNRLAWDAVPEGEEPTNPYSVQYIEPMKFGGEPLIQIRKTRFDRITLKNTVFNLMLSDNEVLVELDNEEDANIFIDWWYYGGGKDSFRSCAKNED